MVGEESEVLTAASLLREALTGLDSRVDADPATMTVTVSLQPWAAEELVRLLERSDD